MKREIQLSYCGMTIVGTVESPDERPAKSFGRYYDYHGEVRILTARPLDSIFLPPWSDIEVMFSGREIAAEPELIDGILG